ncbi:MAG: hypothetical protein U0325_33085 [Polyangiales bacterium]
MVAPNSANCNTALAGLPDVTLPALPAGARATVAASGLLAGTGASAFGLRAFVDGNTRPELGRANLRFVHLSPGAPNVDVGLVNGGTFTPVFTDTPFGAVGNNNARDSFGYLSVAPISGSTIQVRVAGTTTAVVSYSPFNLPAPVARGLSQTVFAIGTVGGTGNARLSGLFCLDREPSAPGLSAPCVRLPASPRRPPARRDAAALTPDKALALKFCAVPAAVVPGLRRVGLPLRGPQRPSHRP